MAPALVREGRDAELGSTAEHFAEFDDEPMAPASIGQVHRAVLRDGRQVAVKLQYPGVAQAIRDDLANTELVATFVRFATSASGMVFDPRTRSHPFIRIPDVLPAACSDRILTMSYLDGMDWAAAQQADQDLKSTWAEVITRFGNGNFRHANLLHADPHPGNYCFNPDSTGGFVDFGCVKILSERMRRLWVTIARAAIDGRSDDVRDVLVQAGFITAGSL